MVLNLTDSNVENDVLKTIDISLNHDLLSFTQFRNILTHSRNYQKSQLCFVFPNFSFVCQNISACLTSVDHGWPCLLLYECDMNPIHKNCKYSLQNCNITPHFHACGSNRDIRANGCDFKSYDICNESTFYI